MTPPTRTSRTARLAALALIAGGLALAACAGDDAATAEAPAPPAADGAAAVEYEPAYPEEVTADGLTSEDAAQQDAAHSHGDETHVHEHDGEHDDEHPDDHDGDHDHGDDGHSH